MVTPDQIHDERFPIRERMEALVRLKQQEITLAVEEIDGAKFHVDSWERGEEGGGGQSMVIQHGSIFEKAGVNISVVYGSLPPQAIARMSADHKKLKTNQQDKSVKFFACGLSLVLHPKNPHAPTTHANYRYFEISDPDSDEIQAWWFGGGADLTPSYINDEDCKRFHQCHKDALDKFDTTLYPKYKKWCDEYFYIKHRQETRGIGGIFFDDFDDRPASEILKIIESCFNAFIPSYIPTIQLRKDNSFTPEQKQWQQIRRGRYVEFNLVLDRGTQFGLQTPGSRIESILMSLPFSANWVYDHHPPEGSEEAKLVQILKNPIEWV